MRREKRRAEFEARYRADQERKRAAKRKRNNTNLSPGSDHPLGDGYAGGRAVTTAAGFLSPSGK